MNLVHVSRKVSVVHTHNFNSLHSILPVCFCIRLRYALLPHNNMQAKSLILCLVCLAHGVNCACALMGTVKIVHGGRPRHALRTTMAKRITDYFLSSTLPTDSSESETMECPPSKRPHCHTWESGFNKDWVHTFPWVTEVESKGHAMCIVQKAQ